MKSLPLHSAVALLALLVAPHIADAQACLGRPSRSSIAFEYGRRTVGSTSGAAANIAGGPVALSLGGRTRSISPELSGWEANLGLDVVIGVSRLKICPGIGFMYQHDTWDVNSTTSLNSHALDLTGGLGVGIEQEVYRGFSVIPFAAVKYRFNAIAFELKTASDDKSVSGDTLSGVQVEYGMSARYRFVFAGIALTRNPDTKGSRPDLARYLIGVTMGGTQKKKE